MSLTSLPCGDWAVGHDMALREGDVKTLPVAYRSLQENRSVAPLILDTHIANREEWNITGLSIFVCHACPLGARWGGFGVGHYAP